MKNHILITISLLLILFGSYFIYTKFSDNNDHLEKIKLAEVTHSPFYAPLYVAIENNYFKEEGLDIKLVLTPGADKVSSALLSNDVEIGLCGPESNIYIYNGGEKDYIVAVAGLTKKDGQFIISRKKNNEFKLTDLENKEVLVGRHGGMPAINFINAIGNNKTIKLNYSVEFANLSSAFISGMGDYVNLFEPNATILENMGLGYIVASVGELSGNVSYTTFNTRLSYYNNHKKELIKFNNALNKALLYVNEHDSKDIASIISKQFPDLSLNELTSIIENYKNVDTWYLNTTINTDHFKNLQTMMINNNLLNNYVDSYTLIKDLNE